ncbi:hypothetical protein PENVUL_c068G07475 [Penicillium vulpinum]|uniref:Protein kinase domain-containing protein n=1 Tax=Penicillium vulpinum TaxID=29845 RepID=A0A1V6RCJ5_9EURO|nr:hypothetical protein PENVUL_c068G07475 [Penicillium vulpinum]
MSSSSHAIALSSPIEEEQIPSYDPKTYYAARIGENVGRYRIVSKLGWAADLKADNLFIGFEGPDMLERYVRQQELDPAPHVFRDGRPIYHSRPDFGPLTKGVGLLKICDFSASVSGDVPTPHNHEIQPIPFCSPEVLLKAGWSYSADIWNLGTVLWELLAETTFFDGACHGSAQLSREAHIAQMIRLLGPPPSQFLKKCDPHIRDGLFSDQGGFE